MASRAEQKAAARAARMQHQQRQRALAERKRRLAILGGLLVVAVTALVIVIVVASGGGGGKPNTSVSKSVQQQVASVVNAELAGLQQHDNVLGNPNAKLTITEFGDLVCSTCAAWANTTESQVIDTYVRTGKAKLVYRAFDTASSYANQSQFVNTQVAARAAGLQGKEWNYIFTIYAEQPPQIGGKSSELVPYVNTAYLQNRAAQIKGLNLLQWQSHLTDQTLQNAVQTDEQAALATGAQGTPAVLVEGPGGRKLDTADPGVPQFSTIQSLVSQVS